MHPRHDKKHDANLFIINLFSYLVDCMRQIRYGLWLFILLSLTTFMGCTRFSEEGPININNVSPEQIVEDVIEEQEDIGIEQVEKEEENIEPVTGFVTLTTDREIYVAGAEIYITLHNNLNIPLNISNIGTYDEMYGLPFKEYYKDGEWLMVDMANSIVEYQFTDNPKIGVRIIKPGENITLSYKGERFTGRMRFAYRIDNMTFYSNEMRFTPAG